MQQTEDLPNHFLSCASPSHSFLGLVARWISEINPEDLWNLSSVVPELGPDSKLRFRTHKQFASTSRKWLAATYPALQSTPPPRGFPVCHLLCQAPCCFLPVKTVWCATACSDACVWLHYYTTTAISDATFRVTYGNAVIDFGGGE